MITPRQRFRRFRARRKRGPNRLAEQTLIAKAEAREVDQRERERQQGVRAKRVRVEGLRVDRLVYTLATLIATAARAIGTALTPVVAELRNGLESIAAPIMRTIGFVFAVAVTVLAIAVDVVQAVGGWIRHRMRVGAQATASALEAAVTPVHAVAFVSLAAAAGLAASQFVYFHGVAVSAPQYAGEVGTIADAPLTDLERTGSAHLYVLGAAAVVAVALIVLTARGRWQLGRVVGLIGLIGIAVTLLIDLPQGLDAGRAGISYEGSEARLIEGFWAQLSASVALLVCGPLLGRYVKLTAVERRPRTEERGEGSPDEPRRRWRSRPRFRSAAGELEAGA